MTGDCRYSFQLISVVGGYAGSSNKEETLGISIKIQILFPRVKEVVRAWTLGSGGCTTAQGDVEWFACRLLKEGCGILSS